MDIELARTFLAVVETGSFLEAATRVNVTQSTVSMRIRSLEDQLGKAVFDRGKTGATLTTAGRHFHRHALALVRTWAQAKIDAGLPEGLGASLQIGATPSLWDGFLSERLSLLAEAAPDAAIRAMMGFSDELLRQLDEGALDLAVTFRPQVSAGLAAEQLFDDEYVLVTSDPDPAADHFGDGYAFFDWGPEFRADHSLNFPDLPTPRLQLTIGTLGLSLFRQRAASGYLPLRLVRDAIREGALRLVEDAPRFAYSVYAVFPEIARDEAAGRAAAALRQSAREERSAAGLV